MISAFAISANAQSQNVTKGTSRTYSVDDEGLTYTWTVTGGTSTDLTAQTGHSVTIDWDISGVYELSVFGTDANNCHSETTRASITVVDEASVMFVDANNNKDVVTCSLLAGDDENATDFKVEFEGGVSPYTLVYELTNQSGSTTEETVSVAGTEHNLSLSDFENTTGSDVIVSIKLKSATTSDGASVTINTEIGTNSGLPNNERKVTVHPKPSISGSISFD